MDLVDGLINRSMDGSIDHLRRNILTFYIES